MSSLDALIEPSWGDSGGFTYAFASCHVVSLGFQLNSLINQLTNQLLIYVMHSQPFISLLVVACTIAVSHCFRDCGISAMPNCKRVKKEQIRSDVPITFEFQMSVRGGCLKHATVIPLDVAMHGGTECRFTLVSQRTPWLCEMVSCVRQMVVAVERGLYRPQA